MGIFTRPLIALSGSASDAELLRYASLALSCEPAADVRLAHVLSDRRRSTTEELRAARDAIAALAREHLHLPNASIAIDIAVGPRVDALLELASAHARDVVLMGHRRTRSARRRLAQRLAMVAPCSIWLAPEGAPTSLRNLLVPVDFSAASADALSLATQLAAARGIPRCRALHVCFDPSSVRYEDHVAEILGREREAFRDFLADVDRHGVDVEPLIEESAKPGEAIARVARKTNADLIVVGTRGRSPAASVVLGSVAAEVIASAETPVLAVRHSARALDFLAALRDQDLWHRPAPKAN